MVQAESNITPIDNLKVKRTIENLIKKDINLPWTIPDDLGEYINPELLEEDEELFEEAFTAVNERTEKEWQYLRRRVGGSIFIGADRGRIDKIDDYQAIQELSPQIEILLDVLDNCMDDNLYKKRPDLYEVGLKELDYFVGYGMFSVIDRSDGTVRIPIELKLLKQKVEKIRILKMLQSSISSAKRE